ncbi:PREDICTED: universal stress protein A-like protein [Nelumbo nucifera]|uniref:UspA domain-containing protein n=2 Tax=Nelumbo nucifera TaxID=4432 RepID=A0A822YHQ9_NELNU|nr:PREDICTED: universal stress protein A-like protein [Nelumbo nucifera]DAD31982.1 TPA_asm: hypothetical protein HUJ06_010833 [Nelumbo nucifera]
MEVRTPRKVMVALECNEENIHVLEWALDYIILPSSSSSLVSDHLVILFIAQKTPCTVALKESMITSNSFIDVEKNENQTVYGMAEQVRNMCERNNITYEMKIMVGDAKLLICEAANKLRVNLLIVGNHDYGGAKRLLSSSSSVSDYCVQHAKCPVMVVKRHQRGTKEEC